MKDCESCVHEYLSPMSDTCRECGIAMLNYEERKPTTHFDWIKSLSVEEVAETYAAGCPNGDRLNCGKYYLHGGRDCFNCWLEWLKATVEVDNGKTDK